MMIAAGNDTQFAMLSSPLVLDRPEWANDERFSTNQVRVRNRDEIIRLIEEVLKTKTTAEWVERLTGKGYLIPFLIAIRSVH